MIIFPKKKFKKEIWLTNISTEKDIMLGDLALKIRRMKSVNVLDERHYHYTEEQIRKSIESGSVYKKRNVIKVRENAPTKIHYRVEVDKPRVLKNPRNKINVEEKVFEELDFFKIESGSDEQFAAEQADTAFYDNEPRLPVGKEFFENPEDDEDES